MQEYRNLSEMLKTNPKVFDYFTSLPAYARSMIATRYEEVHTFEELKGYADNILAGDR